jgi:predicted NAD-dependent protein-ADP-ribosyltransferase YbiA (DUF1768 family)
LESMTPAAQRAMQKKQARQEKCREKGEALPRSSAPQKSKVLGRKRALVKRVKKGNLLV